MCTFFTDYKKKHIFIDKIERKLSKKFFTIE